MIIQGDCIEAMAGMPENSVDAIVTDPPYALGFMGKEWDDFADTTNVAFGGQSPANIGNPVFKRRGKPISGWCEKDRQANSNYQLWTTQWATQALRVLKPGGYLLAFGGTRTYHRLVCGLEDAGFEIRDTICWLYGSGFPKNLDISKQIDKMAGAYIPGETSPTSRNSGPSPSGCYSEGVQHKRLPNPQSDQAKEWQGWGTALKPAHEPICVARKPLSEKNVALNVLKHGVGGIDIDESRIGTDGHIVHGKQAGHFQPGSGETIKDYHQVQGRWPANVILECSCEEVGASHTDPNCPCYMLDEQSGHLESGKLNPTHIDRGKVFGRYGAFKGRQIIQDFGGDSGGASRFYYCAKASSKERGNGNNHPTCKPIKLMEYLIKLVSREGATILDPFAGSGSTELACVALGRKCISIDQSAEYCEMASNRCRQMRLECETLS